MKLIRILFVFLAAGVFPDITSAQDKTNYAQDHILVKFKRQYEPVFSQNSNIQQFDNVYFDELNKRYKFVSINNVVKGQKYAPNQQSIYSITFNDTVNIPAVIKEYQRTGLFTYVEPEYKIYFEGDPIYPTDPYFMGQWDMKDIDMPCAWSVTQGNSSIKVGIIDHGCAVNHPDLKTLGGGSSRVVWGWNFFNNDSDYSDNNGHGSNVTGIAAATGNNDKDIAGMDWNCQLLIYKVAPSTETGWFYLPVLNSIYSAIDSGHVNVMNMSFSFNPDTSVGGYNLFEEAIDTAQAHNVVIVAAMGNNNIDVSGDVRPPASLASTNSNVIAVGATDLYDHRVVPFCFSSTSGSNYGSYISVVAPGDVVMGLDSNSSFTFSTFCGTSQATPHVTGLVSLLMAQYPYLINYPDSIKRIIEMTAVDSNNNPTNGLWNEYYGYGRINACRALNYSDVTSVPSFTNGVFSEPFPNPCAGTFTIKNLSTQDNSSLSYRIRNIQGEIVKQGEIENKNESDFDISRFSNGVYFIDITNLQNNHTVKKVALIR